MKPGMTGSWARVLADSQKTPSLGSLTSYWPATFASIQTALNFFITNGAIPILDWNSCSFGAPGAGFANKAITAGQQDTFLNPWFAACAAWNKPIFIVFDCEMNGNWMGYSDYVTTWGDTTFGMNSAGSFSAMFQHVVNLSRANNCTNISWVFAPNTQSPDGSGFSTSETTQPLAQFWPAGYWDVLSWDGFDNAGSPSRVSHTMTFDQLNRGFAGTLGNTLAHLLALDPNQGILINSFGTDTRLGSDLNPNAATAPIIDGVHRGNWWLDCLLTQLPSSVYNRVIGLLVYDSDNAAATTPFPLPPGFSTTDNDCCVGSPDPAAVSGTYGGLPYTVQNPAAAIAGWRQGISSSLYLQGGKFIMPANGTKPSAYYAVRDTDLLRTSILAMSGLTGFWELNDASGTVLVDSSGNTRNGTVPVGSTITLNQPKVAPQGPASIRFPGDVTNGYASVADNSGFSVTTTSKLTIGCVFQVNTLPTAGTFGTLMSKSASSQLEWALRVTPTGIECVMWALTGATYASVSSSSVVVGQPYIVMVTMDITQAGSFATPSAPKMTMYLYGVGTPHTSSDVSPPPAIADGTGPLNFGRRGDVTSPFNGWMQYAFITNTAQSAATWAELLRAFDPGTVLPYQLNTYIQDILATPGLIDLFVLDDATGTQRIQNNVSTERYLTPHGSIALQQTGIIPATPGVQSLATGGTVADYLDAADVVDWSVATTGQFSITVGFYPTAFPAAGAYGTIVGKVGAGVFEWALRLANSTGMIEFIGWGPTGATSWSAQVGPALLNQWNFVTAIFNNAHAGSGATPSDPKAHVSHNARLTAFGTDYVDVSVNTAAPLNVGRRGDGSQPFTGRISTLALYNVELSRATHDTLYSASLAGAPIIGTDTETLVAVETPTVAAITAASGSAKSAIWYVQNIAYETGFPALQTGYYGQTIDGTNDVISLWESRMAAAMGAQWMQNAKRVPMLAWGQQWMQNNAYRTFAQIQVGLDNCLNAGRMPFLHWGPWQTTPNHAPDYSLRCAAIAAGNHDTFLHQWFAACAAWGRPFFMRWIHEINANGGWSVDDFPWCVGTVQSTSSPTSWTNTPADLINAHRKVRSIQLQEGAINCALATCFNIMGNSGATSVYHLADLYPGSDNQVDINTVDGYNQSSPITGPTFHQILRGPSATPSYSGVRDTWGELLALDPSGTLPCGIAETNCNLSVDDAAHHTARATWYTNMFADFVDPVKFPRAALLAPFYWGAGYDAVNQMAPDYDGTRTTNSDYLAFIRGLGSAKYISYPHFTPLPNRARPTSYAASTQNTPFENAVLSQEVAVGVWNFDVSSGLFTDATGLGRALTNTGMLYQQSPVVPSETRLSAGFTGTSFADGGDLDDWSYVTTGQLCVVATVTFQSVPIGLCTIVGKAGNSAFEWELRANGSAIEFLAWEPLGGNYASASGPIGIIAGAPMLIVAMIDMAATPRMKLYMGDPSVNGFHTSTDYTGSVPTNTTSPLRFGQRALGDHVMIAGTRIGVCAIYKNTIPQGAVQELWNTFSAGAQKPAVDTGRLTSVESYSILPNLLVSQSAAINSAETAAVPGTFFLSDTDLIVSTGFDSLQQSQLLVTTDTGHFVDTQGATLLQLAAPVITSVVASRISDTSVLVTWNTDKPATSQVEYGRTIVYGTLTPIDPTLVTAHSVTLTNLQENTTYHFRVRSDG
jgi:hypothetical protein